MVAETEGVAARARDLVRVTYDDLFVLGDLFEALKYGAWVFVIGIIVFGVGKKGKVMLPTENRPFPEFNAIVYSLDMFLPIIDFYQAKFWLPSANGGHEFFQGKWYAFSVGVFFRLYLWIHIFLGWTLSTLFVVGLTGLVH